MLLLLKFGRRGWGLMMLIDLYLLVGNQEIKVGRRMLNAIAWIMVHEDDCRLVTDGGQSNGSLIKYLLWNTYHNILIPGMSISAGLTPESSSNLRTSFCGKNPASFDMVKSSSLSASCLRFVRFNPGHVASWCPSAWFTNFFLAVYLWSSRF